MKSNHREPRAAGRFRLCHYLGLVLLTLVLGLWIVWLQVSITRLGYAVTEADRQQERLAAEVERLSAEVQQEIITALQENR
jgi:hypothetical protein